MLVEVLIDKFFSHRPTERLLDQWRLLGLDLAGGTVAGALERLEPLFQPVYEALLARNAQSIVYPGRRDPLDGLHRPGRQDRDIDGGCGCFWARTRWSFAWTRSRSHDVPEGHFAGATGVVLMVDRYSAYKAMAQVKVGDVILVFCWAHVRRDFVKVGKAWPELKEWALAWLRRIRDLYRFQRQRLAESGRQRGQFIAADAAVRQTVSGHEDPGRHRVGRCQAPPPRAVGSLESLQEHWAGLSRFVDDFRIPMDNNASERQNRGPAVGRKNYYGSGALWSGRLAAMLFSLFATLKLSNINVRKWLSWYLRCCAQNGGQTPTDINPFLPWNMSQESRRDMALDPNDSS